MVLIVIQTYNSPKFLQRLLISISENLQFSKYPILVMDDSNIENMLKLNEIICKNYNELEINYINKHSWNYLKSQLIKSYFTNKKSILESMWLGMDDWNIFNARNISMLLSKMFYRNCKFILNLDQDILVPKETKFAINKLPFLSCFKINGCPDFSRLNWINIYLIFISKTLKMSSGFVEQKYLRDFVSVINIQALYSILAKFTDFLPDDKLSEYNYFFPDREEYCGASYIISKNFQNKSMFSPWYDNDWLFFYQIRGTQKKVQYINAYLTHASAKKHVVNECLYWEEEGKILTIMSKYKMNVSKSLLINIIKERIMVITNLIKDAERLEKEINDKTINYNLINIVKYLNSLNEFLLLSNVNIYINKISNFRLANLEWRKLYKTIKS